jgi:hypothetical protein
VSKTLRWVVYALVVMAGTDCAATDSACSSDLETGGYVVGNVHLDTPLSFVGAVQSKLLEIQSTLPAQKGKPFHCSDYENGMSQLSTTFGIGSVHPGELFRVALVLPELEACKRCGVPPSVDIVYHIYTSDAAYYASRVFEADHTSLTRRLAPPGLLKEHGRVQPLPYLGYNHARNLFAGSKFSYSSASGLFSFMEADLSGSKDSGTASLYLAGSTKSQLDWVNYLRWKLGYTYENIPGTQLRLKSGKMVLSLLGASRPLGTLGTIARFGSAVEGGNQQARTVGGVLNQGNAYGSVKSYTGITFNLGRQAFAGSYGIQFGSSSPQPSWDYTKHVANLSYSTRLIFAEHKPTAIDAQIGGGYISGNSTVIPVSERFFGGNVHRNFIEGDPWNLPQDPLLRSFPQQDFGQALQNGTLGGTNYYSVNLTVAQTIFNRPVVPPELLADPRLGVALAGQVKNARESEKLSLLAESPDLQKLVLQVETVLPLLSSAQSKSAEIHQALASGAANTDADASVSDLDMAIRNSNNAISIAKTNRTAALDQIRRLILGFRQEGESEGCDQIVPSFLTQILCSSEELQDELKNGPMAEQVEDLVGVSRRIDTHRAELAKAYTSLLSQALLQPAVSQPIATKLIETASILNTMLQTSQDLQAHITPRFIQVDRLTEDLVSANKDANGAEKPEAITSSGDLFAIGFGKLTPPLLEIIREDVNAVEAVVTQADVMDQVHKLRDSKDRLAVMEADLRNEMESLKRPAIEVRAIRDTQFTGRLLDVIFRELNLYAISPFALLDIARLGGTHSTPFQNNRYAPGGGVRFSLVNFNVDVGYAFNVNRQQGEKAGAFYFAMNVSDLFR